MRCIRNFSGVPCGQARQMLRNHRRGTVEASSPSTRLGPHARLHAGRINSAPGQSRQVRQRSDRGEKDGDKVRLVYDPTSVQLASHSNHLNFSQRVNLHVLVHVLKQPQSRHAAAAPRCVAKTVDGTLPSTHARPANHQAFVAGASSVRLAARILVSDPSHPLCHLVIARPSFDAAETGSDQLCCQS